MELIKNIWFLFQYSWAISKRRFLAAGIEIALNTVEPFIYMVFPMLIINELTEAKEWNTVLFYIGLFICCVFVLRLSRILFGVFINMSTNRSDVKDGLSYASHFLKMDYEKLEDETVRDKQKQVSANIRENVFVDSLEGFLTNLFKLMGFSYIIVMLEPVVLFVLLIIIIVNYRINKRISDNTFRYQPVLARFTRMFDYLFAAMTTFDYAKEVRINKADTILERKFDRTLQDFQVDNKKYLSGQMGMNILLTVLSFFQMLLSYGYAAYCAILGRITVGEFSMYIAAIYNLSESFNGVAAKGIELKYLAGCVKEYHAYVRLAMPQGIEKEVNHVPVENMDYPMFEFQDVSFAYPNTGKLVLEHISVKIRKGEKLSVVGLNGAGKTTFIKLLCRLYAPTSGVITYYGVDISTIKREEYRKLLAVVFQDFKIFSFSFLDNIVLNQKLDEKKFNKAVINAGLKQKLDSLPHGIHTSIYKDFDEEGIEFSGGEGQKLVIARAYYKDASLVILDEPTAALDAVAEYEIYEKFHEIIADKTAIFISHRLSSTRFCDCIAVFQDGNIVEYGTHEQLMNEKGLYCEMFQKQAQHYRKKQEG